MDSSIKAFQTHYNVGSHLEFSLTLIYKRVRNVGCSNVVQHPTSFSGIQLSAVWYVTLVMFLSINLLNILNDAHFE